MKKVITIQDISCYGQCSLTVALPILSKQKLETIIVPTAILSTHTAFNNYTYKDLTDEMSKIRKHYEELNLKFNGIYTGYISNKAQADNILEYFSSFGKNALILVDPAMADNGKIYEGLSSSIVDCQNALCQKANIIVPNVTEACLLLNIEYKENYSKNWIEDIAKKLHEKYNNKIVITGVSFKRNSIGVLIYNEDRIRYYFTLKSETSYHGTGDIFSSVLFGKLLNSNTLFSSAQLACDFVYKAILETNKDTHPYGVSFEKVLNLL